jgi:hypothetical protein
MAADALRPLLTAQIEADLANLRLGIDVQLACLFSRFRTV